MASLTTSSSTNNQNQSYLFTPKQQKAFDDYLAGKNIFITGPGGCGKSYFINSLYKHALANDKKIKVTSMTGCSAILLNCRATTIHKWGAFGLAKGEPHEILMRIRRTKRTSNYLETDILVIDEVSMMNEKLFDLIDYLCKHIRRDHHRPFGGIQLICSGDFYQLPPVCVDKTIEIEKNFCFQSQLWNQTFDSVNLFDVNFRQKNDPTYYNILQEIRHGNLSLDTVEALAKCGQKKLDPNDPIVPTKLFPVKSYVDKVNKEELAKLNGKRYTYEPQAYHNNTPIPNIQSIKDVKMKSELQYTIDNSMFETKLELCEGCQVMCISNVDQENNLVNGSQGIVEGFRFVVEKNKYYPIVRFNHIKDPIVMQEHNWLMETNEKYSIQQIPLVLSWAITIHKSQGLSIDKALIDIGSRVFECGQTYVALSRVKSLEGLYLKSINLRKVKAHPLVVEFYKQFEN
jgi:ATP-dependent DNA helicase PIF1